MDTSAPLTLGHMLLIVGIGLFGSLIKNKLSSLFGGSTSPSTPAATSASPVSGAASTHPILAAIVQQFESLVQQQAGNLVNQVFSAPSPPAASTPASPAKS
jgi:hypothetical protein